MEYPLQGTRSRPQLSVYILELYSGGMRQKVFYLNRTLEVMRNSHDSPLERQGSEKGTETGWTQSSPLRPPVSRSQRIINLHAKNQIKSNFACVPLPVWPMCIYRILPGCHGEAIPLQLSDLQIHLYLTSP